MSVLTSLLVGVVGRRAAARFEAATEDPAATQQHKLMEIIHANRDTEYGREYCFSKINNLKDYQRLVPVVTYEDIRGRVDRMANGEKNVLTAEDPVMFAQTSGTTGAFKLIPVTPTCQGRDHADQMRVWLYHAQQEHPRYLHGKILSLVSPAVEGRTGASIPYGSTSGMMYRDMNPLVRRAYAIPYEVFEIKGYDAKYYTIMLLGLAGGITFVATANPSSVLQLVHTASERASDLIRDLHDGTLSCELDIEPAARRTIEDRLAAKPDVAQQLDKKRRQRDGKLLPVDYWPDLELIACWKGGTVGSTVEHFTEWFDPESSGMAPVRDWGYLASEARGSIPLSSKGDGGVLTVGSNVFEFVAVDELEKNPENRERWPFLAVDEIDVGKEYYVFFTTPGGLYRYDIDDVIEVIGMHNRTPVVAFRRKGRGMASIEGEKLSENQVIDAMQSVVKKLDLNVEHFRAEADIDNSRYVFKVEGEKDIPEKQREGLLEGLDQALCELNIEYKGKRSSKRLNPPLLQIMKPGWHERQMRHLAADGKPVFQSKEKHLEAENFQAEPEELEAEIELDKAS